jgi:hypothetical protein
MAPRRLPDELWDIILEHRAATVVQRKWLRHSLYSHARREEWPAVRAHLDAIGMWRPLFPYVMARREWKGEPLSWMYAGAWRDAILCEAEEGLWGRPSARVGGAPSSGSSIGGAEGARGLPSAAKGAARATTPA